MRDISGCESGRVDRKNDSKIYELAGIAVNTASPRLKYIRATNVRA
jgi:hypothetical protein